MRRDIKGFALMITGASSGIGAIYADRLARRGHARPIWQTTHPIIEFILTGNARTAGLNRSTVNMMSTVAIEGCEIEGSENVTEGCQNVT
jgi:hypothetical protein